MEINMAKDTKKELRRQVMYSVFVRNHSEEGNFEGVRKDLDRICGLGVDIIWLLPIHPIGKANRKGELGSPYAISNYREVNPEYGNLEDFRKLVSEIHEKGMKCIIDVVYNHTSPDSWLATNHPEWFYRKPDGNFGNKVGEWQDVIDLDYTNNDLWKYQIDTLKQWAEIVDGFRCDVAPLIPLDFWLEARKEVATVRPDCLWLSESVEPIFTLENRARNMISLSDSEIYQAFDINYEYDVYSWFTGYLTGENTLEEYAAHICQQESIYPDNYVKLRFLENHDNTRAHFLIQDEKMLYNWTAFLYFQKGMTLLYAGQEMGAMHLPSLFDRDKICWDETVGLSELMRRLYQIKKHPLMEDSRYEVWASHKDILCASHTKNDKGLLGIFSVRGEGALISVPLSEGIYTDLITGHTVEVHRGKLYCDGRPLIIEFQKEIV